MHRRQLIRAAAGVAVLAAGLAALPAGAQSSDDYKIIVSGASGNLGGLTVDALLELGVAPERLILVSRTPEELELYGQMGASLRFGDFTQPESLPAAYEGGTRMLLISVGGQDDVSAAELLGRAIDAAKAVGVEHVAYTSYIGLSRGDLAGRAADHQAAEEYLRASGLDWTMLRNSIYMDGQLVRAARRMFDTGTAVVPPDESPISYIARADCALAAATVLATPGHAGRVYDLTGPEVVGFSDIADIVEDLGGRDIELEQAGPDARPGFGRPGMAFTTEDFEELVGRRPVSARDFLEQAFDNRFGAADDN
jgi:NAD(P)H dehydrogenase (quinone)